MGSGSVIDIPASTVILAENEFLGLDPLPGTIPLTGQLLLCAESHIPVSRLLRPYPIRDAEGGPKIASEWAKIHPEHIPPTDHASIASALYLD